MVGSPGKGVGRVNLGESAVFLQCGVVSVASATAVRVAPSRPGRMFLEIWNPDTVVNIFFGPDNTITSNAEPFITPQCAYYFGSAPAIYTGEVWIIHAKGAPLNIPVLEY